MTQLLSQSALYRLLTFLSPAFPVGAFTYSHGLEQVIEDGDVLNTADLQAWLTDILRHGAGRSDAILLKEAWQAASSGDASGVTDLQELGLALQPTKERHLESSAQGTAFIGTIKTSWQPDLSHRAGEVFEDVSRETNDWPYAVAVGLVAAAHRVPLQAALTGFLHAFTANIVSAAVRAVPIGQNDGQKVLAALEPVIAELVAETETAGLDDLGTSTFLADIASMAHETQYSRLFRS